MELNINKFATLIVLLCIFTDTLCATAQTSTVTDIVFDVGHMSADSLNAQNDIYLKLKVYIEMIFKRSSDNDTLFQFHLHFQISN